MESKGCLIHILPVRDALDILNGKWKLPIIVALTFGPKRFKELQKDITGITARMLSKELKDLEINELVKRTVYDTMSVSVEYSLTPYGYTLKQIINELKKWGTKHRTKIMGRK